MNPLTIALLQARNETVQNSAAYLASRVNDLVNRAEDEDGREAQRICLIRDECAALARAAQQMRDAADRYLASEFAKEGA